VNVADLLMGLVVTIVIGRRLGNEVLLLSDTMIGNPHGTGPEIFPGRLKLVTVGGRLTVAFAGNADPAIVVIRVARQVLRSHGVLAAIECLRGESGKGETDFLVASHTPSACLLRLRNGISLEVSDICSLGNDEPFRDLIDKARADHERLAKSELHFRFIDTLLQNKLAHVGVAGFPMAVLATPTGHHYLGSSGNYTYEFPALESNTVTHQPIGQIYTGAGYFMFHVISSGASDIPVVGACLLQARLGWVFSPMESDEVFEVTLAPPGTPWMGKEPQMFNVLRQALDDHVAAIS
jgi:hypothetical protein